MQYLHIKDSLIFAFLVLAFLAGCAPKVYEPVPEPIPEPIPEPMPEPVPEPPVFVPADFDEVLAVLMSGLENQGLKSWMELEEPLKRSLAYVRTRDVGTSAVCIPELCLTWLDIKESIYLLLYLLPHVDRDPQVLEHFFDFYSISPDILLTGYYEPLLEASHAPDQDYRYPVYSLPDDLRSVDLGRFHPRWRGQSLIYRLGSRGIEPYYDRRQIDQAGALRGRGLELAWVKDRIDLFFLHIQGSGRLKYPDGTYRHVLYAGRNGLQYVALGRVLASRGFLDPDEVTMQSIRRFLNENQELVDPLLATNPSYIFFRIEDYGPVGSTGQILTPFVSVASDPALVPWGSILILDADLPDYQDQKNMISGPVLAQDTGGAIRGRHLDLFCGFGPRSESIAGRMKDRARVYLMVRKNDQD